jgi:hypothetical protein
MSLFPDEQVSEEFQRQIEQELMMDTLLERPERKYTDVQDLVADFKLEQRRAHVNETSAAAAPRHDDSDDDDDADGDGAVGRDDELPPVRSSVVGRVGAAVPAPAAPGVVTEAVQRRSGPQTGPKAVIADQKEHVRREFLKWEQAQAAADALAIRNTAVVRTVREDDVHESLVAQLLGGVAVDALADEDGADDQFMREYRAKRVAELKAAAAAAAAARSSFGELQQLTEDAYAAILEDTHSGVVSVVHIFDEQLVACRRLNAKLRLLAGRHTTVRFGAIALAEIGNEFDRSALPLLVVYSNGEVQQTFFNVSHKLGETSFDEHDVERLLAASGVLKLSEVEV